MKIFLSSTYEDLFQIRESAINYFKNILGDLKTSTGQVVAMEFFDASENTCKQQCLLELNSSDLVIGIYGKRYGSIDSETNLSMTEIEFDYATSHNIPILAFVLRDENRNDRQTEFIKNKVYARKLSCANFSDNEDFLDRLDNSLKTYFRTFDGYSFDSLWGEISELQNEIKREIEKGVPGFETKIIPYYFGEQNEAIDSIIFSASCIKGFQNSLYNSNDAVYGYAYSFRKGNVSKKEKKQLVNNVENAVDDILLNGEIIEMGIHNHTNRIVLAAIFLKLCNFQTRLLTERWSEELRKQVVEARDEYKKIINELHLLF